MSLDLKLLRSFSFPKNYWAQISVILECIFSECMICSVKIIEFWLIVLRFQYVIAWRNIVHSKLQLVITPTISLVSENSNLWVEFKIFFLEGLEGDFLGARHLIKDPITETTPGCLISLHIRGLYRPSPKAILFY